MNTDTIVSVASQLGAVSQKIGELENVREDLRKKLVNIVKGENEGNGEKDLPRGALTLAVVKTLAKEQPLSSEELVRKTAMIPYFRNVRGLAERVRHVIYSSRRVKRDDGKYVLVDGPPTTPLFKRLEKELPV